MKANILIEQNARMKNKRANVETTWRQVNNYILPRKGPSLLGTLPGTKQTNRLFDSTAIKANRDLANWMNSNLTSMSMEWFSLRLGVRGAQVQKDAEEWLEECKQREYDALRASNFQAESQKLYLDLPSFCTAAMYMEEREITKTGFNGFRFITLSPGEYCVELDKEGMTAAVFREMKMTAQNCFAKWGDTLSEKTRTLAKNKPLENVNILHAVFPADWFGGEHKTTKEFASYYIEVDGGKMLENGGYDEFPFYVIPWERSSGDIYGAGPGWDAMPDIMTLNEAKMMGLMEWALIIRPPLMMLDDGVIGSVSLKPGGLTTISKPEAIKQFISQARVSESRINEKDLRQAIREIFYADLVRFLPPVEQSKQMTAFEVAQRAELVRLLGPAFGNITDYWLDPMIEKGFYMMYRAGAFSPPPPSIQEIAAAGRENFKIEYEGPLAKAQRAREIGSIVDTLNVIAPMKEAYPDIMDNFDGDEIARLVAAINGVPKKISRGTEGPRGIVAMRNTRAAGEKQARDMEQAAGLADMVQKMGPAVKGADPAALQKLLGAGKPGRAANA